MSERGRPPVFRLFVSSTFGDMRAEREILQARVFPKLRDYCKSRGAVFQAVDLRWGISEEAALDQRTMNICLRELRRCQETTDKPNFLVLLGDRYGWRPLPPQINAEEFEELERALTTDFTDGTDAKGKLMKWYKRDDNAVPAQYVLMPREGEFEGFGKWDCEEKAVRDLLLRALETVDWPAADPRRAKYDHSATHQEIDAGALALPDPEDRVLACFRTITNLPEASDTFSDHDPDGTLDEKARQQLNDLRTALEDRIPKSHRYSYEAESLCASAPLRENLHFDQDSFTAWVEESLRKIIDREIEEKQARAADPLDAENAEHADFGRERAHRFVGRKALLDQIGAYLESTDSAQSPFVVHGVSGTGKTALLGKAVLSRRHGGTENSAVRDPQSAIVLERYIGATPGSSNLRSLLVDLCKQLHRALDFEALKAAELVGLSGASGEEAQKQRETIERKYTIPDDLNKLIEHFRCLPAFVPDDRRLVLVLDALDQLDNEGNPHTFSWLPDRLPGNVRVVVSVLDRPGEPAGRAAESARRLFPDSLHEVTPLGTRDAGELLDGWLADAGRTLRPQQRQSVLRGFAEGGLPLWLKLVSEEARTWHAWHEPQGLPVTIPALLDHFLGELEEPGRHGPELVSTALGYLAAARNGLADEELLDVVALDDDFWTRFTATARQEHRIPERRLPPVLWARLHGDLTFALAQRHADNATLHTFYHRQIAEAARRRYLDPRSRDLHSRLGDYFNAQPHYHEGKPNLRKLSELVPQWIGGERWDDLVGDEEKIGPLSDLFFIQAKCEAGRVSDLVANYNHALAALPEVREENERLTKRDAAMIAYNKALREYAVIRYDWFHAKAHGEAISEPGYPPLPGELRDDAQKEIPEECSPRAARLRQFANFVSASTRLLSEHPFETLPIALNSEHEGPIHMRAEAQVRHGGLVCLQRSPRPPATPLRPQCIRTLEGHSGSVDGVSVSPDGRCAVLVDGTLRVWDLETGECLPVLKGSVAPGSWYFPRSRYWNMGVWDLENEKCLSILKSQTSSIESVSFSQDCRRAISFGCFDTTLRIWDLESKKVLWILEGHSRDVKCMSISPDWRYVVSGSEDMTLRVWEIESGKCRWILKGHTSYVESVIISPDGRRLISGSADTSLRVWDLESGECLRTLEAHTNQDETVSVSPDGRSAVSRGEDGTLRFWNLESGECLRKLEGPSNRVWSVSVSPDGRRAVSGSEDGTIRLWDLETGQCLRTLEGHRNVVDSVSFSPDGRRAVSGSQDRTARLWDLEAGECHPKLEGHPRAVSTLVLSLDGRRAISASGGVSVSDDQSLRTWDLESGKCLHVLEGHTDDVYCLSISPDGQRAVSGGEDKILRVWDLESGKCQRAIQGHNAAVMSVSISPDGRRLISGSRDAALRVWDLSSGRCLRGFEGLDASVASVHLCPDGRRAIVIPGMDDNAVRVMDMESGECLHRLEGHANSVLSVSVSSDGRYVVSGSLDQTLRVWEIGSGQCHCVLKGHSSYVTSVSISPDGRRVVSVARYGDTTLRIWDLESGKCLHVLAGHTDAASCLGISPDGCLVVSGSDDNTLRIWDIESNKCLAIYHTGSSVESIAFAPTGNRIVCGTRDGQMHFLTPINFPPSSPPSDPPIVTAVRLWLSGDSRSRRDGILARVSRLLFGPTSPGHWDDSLTALCPRCGKRFSVHDDVRGQQIACPHCAKPLKINPFVVDRQ